MPAILLPTGSDCTRDCWYITQFSRFCRCEMRLKLKAGEKMPPCPKCGKPVNWVMIEWPERAASVVTR